MYFITVKLSPIFMIVPKSVFCFLVYFTTDRTEDAFELPLPMWSVKIWRKFRIVSYSSPNIAHIFVCSEGYPLIGKNLRGFFVAISLQYVTITYFYLFVASFSSFGIGSYLVFTGTAKEIRIQLSSFSNNGKTKRTERESFMQLKNFVESFSQLKQLSDGEWCCNFVLNWNFNSYYENCLYFSLHNFRNTANLSKLFQPIFMVLFAWSILSICFSMLMFQKNIVQ